MTHPRCSDLMCVSTGLLQDSSVLEQVILSFSETEQMSLAETLEFAENHCDDVQQGWPMRNASVKRIIYDCKRL